MKRILLVGLLALGVATAGTFAASVIANPGPTDTTPAPTTTAPATTATTTTTSPVTTAPVTTTAPTTTARVPPKTTTTPLSGRTLPSGVRVAGVKVGGLTHDDAVSAIQRAFAQPVRVVVDHASFSLDPPEFASAYTATAVAKARLAAPRANVQLVVAVRGAAVRAWVATIAKRYDRPAVNAKLSFRNDAPHVTADSPRRHLDTKTLTAKIVATLTANTRQPVRVSTKLTPAAVTAKSIGPVIVINRARNRLELFNGMKPVRTFAVATGQAIYPTPKGTFHIVVKQRDPWWYPPTYDAWAANLKPVPPGPDNPLGTRWMGLSVPGVGIHGTDEPTSIGYSESHGCIRMQVPDAEWLFERVDVGTTVHIV